ncbi:phage tail protein [Symbiopectobacterium sp. RP]|uniref:Phage tail protein n=1 Tax=Rhodnius prolixus TaxID=13249 RepID=T1HJM5_RHOPR
MADDSLNTPVKVRAVSIKAVSLPVGFSPAYQQYVLSQAMDFTQVAGKANQAADGAYNAQVVNDAQNVTLADHEGRIAQLRIDVDGHEIRITANTNSIAALDVRVTSAEGAITPLQTRMTAAEGNITTLQTSVAAIQTDYASRSATAPQSLASPLNVAASYSVNGTKVLGPQQTGWTAAAGTAFLGAFNADQSYAAGATCSQADIQALAAGLVEARQRTKALEDALRAHGLIN